MCISALVSPIIYPYLSYFYVATGMSTKMKAAITDRATAKKAKAYVYGVKEMRNLAAVKKTTIFLEKNMAYSPIDEHTSYNTITRAMTVVVHLTLFVLYLYMVWSFMNN